MPAKRIPITSLKVGMFVCGMDRSWLHTPFFTHRFQIQNDSQIEKLKQCGIKELEIDPSRGLDAATEQPENQSDNPMTGPVLSATHLLHPTDGEIEVVGDDSGPGEKAEEAGSKPPWVMARELESARGARQELLKQVHSVFENVSSTSTIPSDQVRGIVQDILSKTLDNQAAFLALVRSRQFDPTLRDHMLSVSTLATIMGKTLGYSPAQLQLVASGALLHDVGLLRLPHYMYRMPQALKKGERSLYLSHPQLGHTLLKRNGGFPDQVLAIVLEHHDGLAEGGRERASAREHFSDAGQLVMTVDRYDELLSGQHDSQPLAPHQALSRLYQEAQAGTLDMQLVSTLIRVIGVYPLYSMVILNTGERGIVVAISPGKLHQPSVAIFRGADGEPCNPPRVTDLSCVSAGSEPRSITTSLNADEESLTTVDILAQLEPTSTDAARPSPRC